MVWHENGGEQRSALYHDDKAQPAHHKGSLFLNCFKCLGWYSDLLHSMKRGCCGKWNPILQGFCPIIPVFKRSFPCEPSEWAIPTISWNMAKCRQTTHDPVIWQHFLLHFLCLHLWICVSPIFIMKISNLNFVLFWQKILELVKMQANYISFKQLPVKTHKKLLSMIALLMFDGRKSKRALAECMFWWRHMKHLGSSLRKNSAVVDLSTTQ